MRKPPDTAVSGGYDMLSEDAFAAVTPPMQEPANLYVFGKYRTVRMVGTV